MADLDAEKPKEYHPSGGMRSAMGAYALTQTGMSGPGMSGYIDLRPDTGIPGYAWLGIAAGILLLAIWLWSWLIGL